MLCCCCCCCSCVSLFPWSRDPTTKASLFLVISSLSQYPDLVLTLISFSLLLLLFFFLLHPPFFFSLLCFFLACLCFYLFHTFFDRQYPCLFICLFVCLFVYFCVLLLFLLTGQRFSSPTSPHHPGHATHASGRVRLLLSVRWSAESTATGQLCPLLFCSFVH